MFMPRAWSQARDGGSHFRTHYRGSHHELFRTEVCRAYAYRDIDVVVMVVFSWVVPGRERRSCEGAQHPSRRAAALIAFKQRYWLC
jgi:hypothetical protein